MHKCSMMLPFKNEQLHIHFLHNLQARQQNIAIVKLTFNKYNQNSQASDFLP